MPRRAAIGVQQQSIIAQAIAGNHTDAPINYSAACMRHCSRIHLKAHVPVNTCLLLLGATLRKNLSPADFEMLEPWVYEEPADYEAQQENALHGYRIGALGRLL
jgi:hypothetical protein